MTKYLTAQQIQTIHQKLMQISKHNNHSVQDPDELQAIVDLPKQCVFGQVTYPELFDKAAILMQKLIKKHVFSNGNQRTAIIATMTFLKLNQYQLVIGFDQIDTAVKTINEFTQKPDDQTSFNQIKMWIIDNSHRLKHHIAYPVILTPENDQVNTYLIHAIDLPGGYTQSENTEHQTSLQNAINMSKDLLYTILIDYDYDQYPKPTPLNQIKLKPGQIALNIQTKI